MLVTRNHGPNLDEAEGDDEEVALAELPPTGEDGGDKGVAHHAQAHHPHRTRTEEVALPAAGYVSITTGELSR